MEQIQIHKENKFGKVKLVAITQPLIMVEDRQMSPEEFIVYTARVSNPNNQLNTKTSAGLLRYCMKHKHWSIFDQVDLTFEIHTTRDISAQMIRHRSFMFQEFSQRYAAVDLGSMPEIELRLQGNSKQGSADLLAGEELNVATRLVNRAMQSVNLVYDFLLNKGVSRETARKILPINSPTTLYMKGSLRSWLHYLSVRCLKDTQREHRAIAKMIREVVRGMFPITYGAFAQNLQREAQAMRIMDAVEHLDKHTDSDVYQELRITKDDMNNKSFVPRFVSETDHTNLMGFYMPKESDPSTTLLSFFDEENFDA